MFFSLDLNVLNGLDDHNTKHYTSSPLAYGMYTASIAWIEWDGNFSFLKILSAPLV